MKKKTAHLPYIYIFFTFGSQIVRLTWHGGLYDEVEANAQPAPLIQDVPGHLSVWPARRTQQYLIKLAMNLLQRVQGLRILGHLKSRKTQAGERAGWR